MKPSLCHEAYELLADSYASLIDTKPHNAHYERPATFSLLADISQHVVLDAGCGPGAGTERLLERGASVVAIDSSERMLFHARRRVGDRAVFHQRNLEEPLDFLENEQFDGILSSLAVTYVRDHRALVAEFCRILRPGGWLVFSTEHPFFSYQYFKLDAYFETQEVACDWRGFGGTVRMPSYHHSLGTICGALADNGFVIERLVEPKPSPEFLAADPTEYQKLLRFPSFICIRARKESERRSRRCSTAR